MIKDLQPGQDSVSFFALVNRVVAGKTNGTNRSTYLNLNLQDQTDEINAKLWNATDEQVEEIVEGAVVEVVGDVIKYNTDRQLKINQITFISTEESEQIKFLRQAPVSGEKLMIKIKEYIASISNEKIRKIVDALIIDCYDKFEVYPAASKNHHEFVSGLAYHTYSMLRLAKGLTQLYPQLNKDLLFSGVILHDLGKTVELTGPTVPQYSTEGKLLGHISIASSLIALKAKELNIEGEEVMLLQHLVLSHHGKNEFGSPVLPMIREAELLTLIDNIDARMMMIDKALEGVSPGEFSSRIFPLENRVFYKPKK